MRKLSAAIAVALAGALAGPSQAAIMKWDAILSGSQEIPANASTATGSGWVQFDDATNELSLSVQWDGLTGPAVQAHIHCCVTVPPGNVAIAIDLWLPGDPRPATGLYEANYYLDLENPFRASFVDGGTVFSAMQALIAAMDAGGGRAYFNIHTAEFPPGEIRGNLAVPEPATLPLLIGGLGLVWAGRRFARS